MLLSLWSFIWLVVKILLWQGRYSCDIFVSFTVFSHLFWCNQCFRLWKTGYVTVDASYSYLFCWCDWCKKSRLLSLYFVAVVHSYCFTAIFSGRIPFGFLSCYSACSCPVMDSQHFTERLYAVTFCWMNQVCHLRKNCVSFGYNSPTMESLLDCQIIIFLI